MLLHGTRIFVAATALTTVAVAQVPATNDIATCSLVADPTAQRLCIESARQSRPASTIDSAAQPARADRRTSPGRDALSPLAKPSTPNTGSAPATTGSSGQAKSYRETNWRLQIP